MKTITKHGRRLGGDAAYAIGRFRPQGPLGYKAKSIPDAELRKTRGEAITDEVKHWEEKNEKA